MTSSEGPISVDRPNEVARMVGGDIVRRAANRTPEKAAFIVPESDGEISFAAFNDRVNQTAHALWDAGLEKGGRLVVISPNSLEFLVSYFGALKAGVVFVPINPKIDREDIAYEIDHSEADALIVEGTLYSRVEPILDGRSVPLLASFRWEDETVPSQSFQSFYANYPTDEPDVDVSDDDLAQIMYTSGTTSRPKGVLLSHKAIHTGSINHIVGHEITRNDVLSAFMPLYHCAQLGAVKAGLHVSATSILQREFDPEGLLAAIERYGITIITVAIPDFYRQLLEQDLESRDIATLELCVYAMTPIGNETIRHLIDVFDADFGLGSGQTEAYPPTCFYHPEWQLRKEGNYWGRGIVHTDIAIMDNDGTILPRGEVGEIVYRGPNVMDGYLKDEEQTREAFAHGWFHSGDMGFFDEDDLLKFVDRKKDMIKSGGLNVSTQKVESTLLDHPDLVEVAVVGLPHDRWGEAVTVFAKPRDGDAVDEDEIIEWARDRLAGFETPKAVTFVESFSKTATGKIQKHQLKTENEGYYRVSSLE